MGSARLDLHVCRGKLDPAALATLVFPASMGGAAFLVCCWIYYAECLTATGLGRGGDYVEESSKKTDQPLS